MTSTPSFLLASLDFQILRALNWLTVIFLHLSKRLLPFRAVFALCQSYDLAHILSSYPNSLQSQSCSPSVSKQWENCDCNVEICRMLWLYQTMKNATQLSANIVTGWMLEVPGSGFSASSELFALTIASLARFDLLICGRSQVKVAVPGLKLSTNSGRWTVW